MVRISEVFGRDLSLVTIFQAQTVESLVGHVLRADGEPAERSLVAITTGRPGRPPFFCVHPAGGDILGFEELARELGDDQPFYGLQSLGRVLEDRYHPSLEQMAQHYLDELRSASRAGPISWAAIR